MKRLSPVFIILSLFILSSSVGAREPRKLKWVELLPESDLKAMERLPETMEEMNRDLLEKGVDKLTDDVEMPEVLRSTKVRSELEGEYIKLPGFPVPLEMNKEGGVIRFFLVPWFGACIHTPPPPPNQILHVTYDEGKRIDDIRNPVWVTGPLEVEKNKTEEGLSTYAVTADAVERF
jgi:hypothetical protein